MAVSGLTKRSQVMCYAMLDEQHNKRKPKFHFGRTEKCCDAAFLGGSFLAAIAHNEARILIIEQTHPIRAESCFSKSAFAHACHVLREAGR